MINAPKAWDTERGKSSVIVAVIDSGVSRTHPDLKDRLLPGYDFADNDTNPSPGGDWDEGGHGTHVAGIIAAQGNNNLGVCGVCWDNVKILPIKYYKDGGVGGGDTATELQCLDYAMAQGAKVVNMSFGGYFYDQLEHEKLKQLSGAGIILVGGAGNDSTDWLFYPASYPEVIAVSAVGPTENLASYSNYGAWVDIAAPGGDAVGQDMPENIWSTIWNFGTGDGYAGWDGTSMATPHVSGACALLLSYGVSSSQVPGKLYRAARAPISGILDPIKYGHGILDLASSLNLTGEIDIISPSHGAVLDTTTPVFKVTTNLIDKQSIKVYLDYVDANKDGSPDDETQNIVLDGATMDSDPNIQWDADTESFTFVWPVSGQVPFSPGTHTICITANGSAQADPALVKDWMVFFIQPKVIPAGRHLFSVPYPLSADVDPYDLFATTNFHLARFIPARGTYAKINYPGEPDDMEAWFGSGVYPVGSTSDTPPAGLAFWVVFYNDTPIVINGVSDTTKAYNITLTRGTSGWNMIGNPFPFPVPWESVKVTYQGKTMTLNDAVAANWIRPALYRYTKFGYTCQNPPEAVLVPWEGHWVRVLPDNPEKVGDSIVLQVPPISSGAIIETPNGRAATAVSRDSWSLRLEARVGNVVDAYNLIGINSRAADGYDALDVEKPPMTTDDIQLAFVHNDWGKLSGRYTTDYRSGIGTGKSWEFNVTTDIPNKDVSISWPDIAAVPKAYNLILEDLDTGNRAYMRTRSAYTYNSGAKPGTKRFKLQVVPATTGAMMITNVSVNRTKASGVSIGYNISRDARVVVRVRDSRNKLIRTLDGNKTRAAGLNTIQWDCTADDSKPVTSGLYLAEIIATGPDGEVAKATRPILVR
jgi:hypothetical protein